MDKEDAVMAFNRHATSKIIDEDDLYHIHTLGFRGEALASIASVSRLNILSRVSDSEVGYSFDCIGGDCSEIYEQQCNVGTKVKVADLFFNTPARRKFLKTDRSEENSINDMVTRMILANPTVSFKYIRK